MMNIEIKTEYKDKIGEYPVGTEVVYVDGKPVKEFNHMSDDYAIMNAREYAKELERENLKGK